jgi:amidohydrolase
MLMGVASLLSEMRDSICGNVKFLFQPAEEGPGGAKPMIEAGALLDPKVDACIGLHIYTDLPSGKIGIQYGTISAASDSLEIKVKGMGGHGAGPHQTVDAIAVTGNLLMALQTIVSREISPTEPAVVTIGTIHGGYRGNVIADEVVMTGTVRTLSAATRKQIPERIERVVKGVTDGMRASYEMRYGFGYPSVVNDKEMTALVDRSAREIVGQDNVEPIPAPTMGAEDFAYFAEAAPSCFFRLGGRNESKGVTNPGHNARYDFDEDIMPLGVAVLSMTALNYLCGK